MSTPNIEELMTYLRGFFIDENVSAVKANQIANALQSQAERMAVLERESETHSKAYGLAIVERDNLRAQLAAIAATEPVLVVEKEPDYWSGGHFHEGSKSHIKSTKVWRLPVGTQLFTRPMPAQDVTLSLTDAEIAEVQASDPAYMTCSCMKFAWDILAAANAKGAK